MASLGRTTLCEQAPRLGCLNKSTLLPTEEISPLQTSSATWDLTAHAGDWLIPLHKQQTAGCQRRPGRHCRLSGNWPENGLTAGKSAKTD